MLLVWFNDKSKKSKKGELPFDSTTNKQLLNRNLFKFKHQLCLKCSKLFYLWQICHRFSKVWQIWHICPQYVQILAFLGNSGFGMLTNWFSVSKMSDFAPYHHSFLPLTNPNPNPNNKEHWQWQLNWSINGWRGTVNQSSAFFGSA